MACAAEAPFGLRQFDAINLLDRTFLVAPNPFATETNRGKSAFCGAVGSLRFHGRALFAPQAPISSLLHNIGKYAKLCGGEGWIRTPGTLLAIEGQNCAQHWRIIQSQDKAAMLQRYSSPVIRLCLNISGPPSVEVRGPHIVEADSQG
jgi:hypothetical protein